MVLHLKKEHILPGRLEESKYDGYFEWLAYQAILFKKVFSKYGKRLKREGKIR